MWNARAGRCLAIATSDNANRVCEPSRGSRRRGSNRGAHRCHRLGDAVHCLLLSPGCGARWPKGHSTRVRPGLGRPRARREQPTVRFAMGSPHRLEMACVHSYCRTCSTELIRGGGQLLLDVTRESDGLWGHGFRPTACCLRFAALLLGSLAQLHTVEVFEQDLERAVIDRSNRCTTHELC